MVTLQKEKMTIHKALCELKTIEDRIEKKIDQFSFVFTNKHSNQKISGVPLETYKAEIASAYQSVRDLISRAEAIKRAVTMSNATTVITVAGVQYTVAEAIYMKNGGIPMEKKLLDKLSFDSRRARMDADRANGDALERKADEYIKSMYDSVSSADMGEDARRSREEYVANNSLDVVDPINSAKVMAEIEERISTFIVDVDSALSVSNAITEIEIEY